MYNSSENISVVDVYDVASQIGAECQKIIDLYGINSVKTLIPRCIQALEMLENLASKNEIESSMVQELKDQINKLEDEKIERAETKKKFEKVSEHIEKSVGAPTHISAEYDVYCKKAYRKLSKYVTLF